MPNNIRCLLIVITERQISMVELTGMIKLMRMLLTMTIFTTVKFMTVKNILNGVSARCKSIYRYSLHLALSEKIDIERFGNAEYNM